MAGKPCDADKAARPSIAVAAARRSILEHHGPGACGIAAQRWSADHDRSKQLHIDEGSPVGTRRRPVEQGIQGSHFRALSFPIERSLWPPWDKSTGTLRAGFRAEKSSYSCKGRIRAVGPHASAAPLAVMTAAGRARDCR